MMVRDALITKIIVQRTMMVRVALITRFFVKTFHGTSFLPPSVIPSIHAVIPNKMQKIKKII